ncbi:MAG: hypothetical protein AB7S44_01105 [Spirochaetales bacterium]
MLELKNIDEIKENEKELLGADKQIKVGNVIIDYSNLGFIGEDFLKLDEVLTLIYNTYEENEDTKNKFVAVNYNEPVGNIINGTMGRVAKIEDFMLIGYLKRSEDSVTITLREDFYANEDIAENEIPYDESDEEITK